MSEPFRDPLDPPRVHYSLRSTENHKKVSEADVLANPNRIEVKQILRDNVAAEASARAPIPGPGRYKSRKKRDFILLILVPNILLASLAFYFRANQLVVVIGLSLMALFTVLLTWLMWVVMDGD